MKIVDLVYKMNPCAEAQIWLEKNDDLAEAWAKCKKPSWMVWGLASLRVKADLDDRDDWIKSLLRDLLSLRAGTRTRAVLDSMHPGQMVELDKYHAMPFAVRQLIDTWTHRYAFDHEMRFDAECIVGRSKITAADVRTAVPLRVLKRLIAEHVKTSSSGETIRTWERVI